MADITIISAGGALIGSGTWFAGKVFGPSAEALGDQLKLYLTARIEAIFERAGRAVADRAVELAPVPPGMLARMITDASFSENSEEITEWWANLFIDASMRGSNKHVVFSDIMSSVGPSEAQCLDDILSEFLNSDLIGQHAARGLSGIAVQAITKEARQWLPDEVTVGIPEHGQTYKIISEYDCGLPAKILEWELPFIWRPDQEEASFKSHHPWSHQHGLSIDILRRSGVFDTFECRPNNRLGSVKIVCPTPLGIEFYKACKGIILKEGPIEQML